MAPTRTEFIQRGMKIIKIETAKAKICSSFRAPIQITFPYFIEK